MSTQRSTSYRRFSALAVTLVGIALAVSACGPDHPSGRTPPPPIPIATPTPTPVAPTACLPSSSLSVLVQGEDVLSYVPKGAWDTSTTGVSLIQIEGSGTAPGLINTPHVVNSCASNSATGATVCVANNTDVYLLSGLTLEKTLTSGGSGTIGFSGGNCTNCGVVFNAETNQAAISLSIGGTGGFQFLDLGGASPTFEPAYKTMSPTGEISEDIAIDPARHLLLSPDESSNYEIQKIATTTSPEFFENDTSSTPALKGEYDSAGEDCTTGIALATDEFTGDIYLADLNQATFTPGSPGKWTAPEQRELFPEFADLAAGTCAIAVAGGSHTAVVNGEFGGNLIGAVQLPSTPGTGGTIPAVVDYVVCTIPKDPKGVTWATGLDPHTTTAYVSPSTGDAMALVANGDFVPVTYVAVVDLTKLLNPAIVPRIKNGFASAHTCDPSVNLETAGIVRFVAVP